MPRIPQRIINGVFYLYRNREDALAGRDAGGTGFIVHYQGHGQRWFRYGQYYGVTNWHVACAGGFSVIRLNKNDGGTDIIEFGPDEWQFLPGKHDVAVVPLSLNDEIHEVASVSTYSFAMPPDVRSNDYVGVGDDVFMIGLFIDHDGTGVNVPSARFGNVSMLPNERATIEQPNGYRGVSYVVDMHSRTGFSGSPVYVYRTFANDLTNDWGEEFEAELKEMPDYYSTSQRMHGHSKVKGRLRSRNFLRLLGVHWGQFPETWELRDKSRMEESRRKHLIVEGGYVEGMSGMTCVIPAWQILETLDMPHLKNPRDVLIAELAEQRKRQLKPKPGDAIQNNG